MDPSGKLIYTKTNSVLSGNVQTIADAELTDGNRIPLAIKEIGTTEIYATTITHSPNGRFVTVVGDGEYIVYTALAWRNKAFGNGSSFAWANDSNTYAVLEGPVELTAVASSPDDVVVDELVDLYRALAGEHENWEVYRQAMVAERRAVIRLIPSRAYGMLGRPSVSES